MDKKELSKLDELDKCCRYIKKAHLRNLFKEDPQRARNFTIVDEEIYFDYSKNLIDETVLGHLISLARIKNLKSEMERMFAGEKINETEKRSVLHVALRAAEGESVHLNGIDIMGQVQLIRDRMKSIANKVRERKWIGFSGKPIKNIVNIGIGGSDLGPLMATEALKFYSDRELRLFFVSNVDGTQLAEILRQVTADETLFIIVSKSFATLETLTNAWTARDWFLSEGGPEKSIGRHFLAVTAKIEKAKEFGIETENILGMWDWVGGRFSLTSAVGLPIMISIGYENFMELIRGFHTIDKHFRNAPLEKNIPVIMALIGIWYIKFFNADTQAVLPYDQYLIHFPAYLQQLDMESNGKSIDRYGNPVTYATGPIVWGDVGTNGQHAFFQLIHQGTRFVPCDFIGFLKPLYNLGDHHRKLMANFFGQTEALAFGKTREELLGEGIAQSLIPYRTFPGNRPSNTILFTKLEPFTLGQLIALYEHKVFTQGVIWNIFSFDQWGVELGKKLAKRIIPELEEDYDRPLDHDSSTNALISIFKKVNAEKNASEVKSSSADL